MAEQAPIDPAEQPNTLPPKPGGVLKAAREARGLSLDELVVQTKLPRSMIDAIEDDNFALLSEPVYVRGYYRKYARVVGADEATVITAYEAHAGGELPKLEIPVLLQDEPMRQRRRWPLVILILLIVLGVLGLAWWLLDSSPESTTNTPTTSSSAAPSVNEPATSREAPEESPPSRTSAAEPSVGSRSSSSAGGARRLALETAIASAPQPVDPAPAPEAEPEVAEPEPPPSLVLRFEEASWVRVEDGSGRRVLNGLVQGGEVREIDEDGPYAVFLGYAPGVEVSHLGEPVDVSAYVRGNNTARFTVE